MLNLDSNIERFSKVSIKCSKRDVNSNYFVMWMWPTLRMPKEASKRKKAAMTSFHIKASIWRSLNSLLFDMQMSWRLKSESMVMRKVAGDESR